MGCVGVWVGSEGDARALLPGRRGVLHIQRHLPKIERVYIDTTVYFRGHPVTMHPVQGCRAQADAGSAHTAQPAAYRTRYCRE